MRKTARARIHARLVPPLTRSSDSMIAFPLSSCFSSRGTERAFSHRMPQITKAEALAVLAERFGHDAFQHGQWESIRPLLTGRDSLVVMPTGSGKSIVYQLPALLLPGLTVVVSPLIALMKDQHDKLTEKGV